MKPPTPERKPIVAFNTDQVAAILTTAEATHGAMGVARMCLAILAGLRQSEALGLRWSMVELDRGEAYIHHSRPRRSWQHGCGDPPCGQPARLCPRRAQRAPLDDVKSAAGHRTVVLSPVTVAALKALKAQQARERLAVGELWGQRRQAGGGMEKDQVDWVLVDQMGRRLEHRRDLRMWSGILQAAGLEHLKLHGARHTGATFALASGVDEVTIMTQFGWSTRTMLATYGHPGTTDQKRLVDAVDAMIGPAPACPAEAADR